DVQEEDRSRQPGRIDRVFQREPEKRRTERARGRRELDLDRWLGQAQGEAWLDDQGLVVTGWKVPGTAPGPDSTDDAEGIHDEGVCNIDGHGVGGNSARDNLEVVLPTDNVRTDDEARRDRGIASQESPRIDPESTQVSDRAAQLMLDSHDRVV